jgi:ATP-dependent Clp protease ATP-binding subunit ClpC
LPHGASIGFSQEQAQFAAGAVERAVVRSFRREFVNRIDRVVVFRPLGRSIMRDLLRKELNDVLRRRGLRMRQWAVEWDESAIDFLLEKGFTADLGARPLKRAIERYLLSPLALTIVNHQFPEGDQFLFVRARAGDESLDVEFIDPDALEFSGGQAIATGAPAAALDEESDTRERELRLEGIVSDARGTLAEVQFLQDKFEALADQVDAEEWQGRKASALLETSAPGFWNSPARFTVLGLAEYMDRIETGLDTAGSLLKRLTGAHTRGRQHFPADLVARLAHQLYLIDAASRGLAAGHPRDAFLSVRASCEAGADNSVCNAFARRIAEMYRLWAEARRMRFEILEETKDAAATVAAAVEPYQMTAAVSGFAAYSLLHAEAGLHVLETPQDEKSFNRARVQVRVVAQPDEPAGREGVRGQAARAFAADANGAQQIVRRYREEPSPLVRDSVRGWRTGKLSRVLEGGFDLMF